MSAASSACTRPATMPARLAYFALYALQHRGQESAGIATCEGGHITTLRDTGLVSQVFDEEKLRALDGDMAIGHVRYSTTGGGSWENSQPVWRDDGREVALAHNGNLTNAVELYNELRERGIELPRHLGLGDHRRAALGRGGAPDRERGRRRDAAARGRLLDRGDDQARGGRLPRPERGPAAVARQDRQPLLRRLGELRLRHHRRRADARGAARGARRADRRRARDPPDRAPTRPAHCVFEHIYFSRPDSRLEGRVLQEVRGRMGEILAREAPRTPTW